MRRYGHSIIGLPIKLIPLDVTLALALVAWLLSGAAHGEETRPGGIWVEGADLTESCLSSDDAEAWLCNGYIAGVVDMIGMENFAFGHRGVPTRVCLPYATGTPLARFISIVKKYIRDHPEERYNAGVVLVVMALRDAFPCPD